MNHRQWLVAAGTLLLVLGPVTGSFAAEAFKVCVIDQQAVFEKTKAGQRALKLLKEFSASRQKIIAADDEEMKKLENELRAQESGLGEAAYREKQEMFRTKLANYQRRLQEFNREIQTKQKEKADEYLKKMTPAVAAVAKKAGCAAAIDKGSDATFRIVLYHRNTIDLTDKVVKEFDRRYK